MNSFNVDDCKNAALLNSQVACALIESAGMTAENMQREALGQSMAYDENAFMSIIHEHGIGYNSALTTLKIHE